MGAHREETPEKESFCLFVFGLFLKQDFVLQSMLSLVLWQSSCLSLSSTRAIDGVTTPSGNFVFNSRNDEDADDEDADDEDAGEGLCSYFALLSLCGPTS